MGGQRDTLQYPWGYHNCPYLDSITWGYDIHGSTRDNEIPNRWIFGASFRCTQIYPNIISSWLQYIYSIYIYTIIKLVTVYIYGTVKLYLLVGVPRESAGQFQWPIDQSCRPCCWELLVAMCQVLRQARRWPMWPGFLCTAVDVLLMDSMKPNICIYIYTYICIHIYIHIHIIYIGTTTYTRIKYYLRAMVWLSQHDLPTVIHPPIKHPPETIVRGLVPHIWDPRMGLLHIRRMGSLMRHDQ